jgi:arsenate reductase
MIGEKIKILFICVHNSARSQIAEAFVNNSHDTSVIAESAGLEAGSLNPLAVEAMKEMGIDISVNKTKTVFEILKSGKAYDYVITVCDKAQAERCPVFPGKGLRIHWDFPDPALFKGSREQILQQMHELRDKTAVKVKQLLSNINV